MQWPFLENGIVVYLLLLNGMYLVLFFSSLPQIWKHLSLSQAALPITRAKESITILVPAFNEEKHLRRTVEHLMRVEYADKEVIFINDGSSDRTLSLLLEALEAEPVEKRPLQKLSCKAVKAIYQSTIKENFYVIDKEAGGKSDALNCGLNFTHSRYFVVNDADTFIEKQAVDRLYEGFLRHPEAIAMGGAIRPYYHPDLSKGGEWKQKTLFSLQQLEYLKGFLFERLGWCRLGGNFIVFGAFGFFNTGLVVEVGGYDAETVGEDLELIIRLIRHQKAHHKPSYVGLIPDAVAWSVPPLQWQRLFRQRERWHRGLIESMMKHRRALWNIRLGTFGWFTATYLFLGEMFAPLVEASCYAYLLLSGISGEGNAAFAWIFLTLTLGVNAFLSLACHTVDVRLLGRGATRRKLFSLIGLIIGENVGYRQWTLFARAFAFYQLFVRKKKGWI